MPRSAKLYIDVVISVALTIVLWAAVHWDAENPPRLALFLALFAGAALLKGRIPGITGTYSPVFFFIFLGSQTLSLSELVLAAGLAGIVQCTLFVQRRPSMLQVAFNAGNMTISSAAAFLVIRRQIPGLSDQPLVLLLALGASVYFLVNTGLVSIVAALAESRPLSGIWRQWCLASLPFYIAGAVLAGATVSATNTLSMFAVGMVCPSMFLITVYYRYWLKSATPVNTL